ncbi:hypothetical protein [Methylobacterium indicum]|uniref:hypothetical protein n=1 Tax=Methylobacterium indicum TaxID=1775910 RepID=UPI00243526AD|nr:hypothetical protein [Methylobacterium indicum]
MRLHWNRVRRARRLPAPLPPTPKRPLGPPVLFGLDGRDIRLRADVVAAYGSWEAFLDHAAQVGLDALEDRQGGAQTFFHSVTRLVPDAERRDLYWELNQRMRGLLRRRHGERVTVKETPTRDGGIMQRLFGRAA